MEMRGWVLMLLLGAVTTFGTRVHQPPHNVLAPNPPNFAPNCAFSWTLYGANNRSVTSWNTISKSQVKNAQTILGLSPDPNTILRFLLDCSNPKSPLAITWAYDMQNARTVSCCNVPFLATQCVTNPDVTNCAAEWGTGFTYKSEGSAMGFPAYLWQATQGRTGLVYVSETPNDQGNSIPLMISDSTGSLWMHMQSYGALSDTAGQQALALPTDCLNAPPCAASDLLYVKGLKFPVLKQ